MDYPISVPSVGLVDGKFVDEDPVAGTPGSLIPSAWGNAVTDEILNVIIQAGLTPDEEDNTQLRAAIAAIIDSSTTTRLATKLEAEAGADSVKLMSPLRVFQAIAKVVGQATETVFGWAKVATQPQTNAGTDDTAFVTPKKLRAGVSMLLSSNGYIAFPTWLGGLIIQWGTATVAGGSSGTAVPMSIGFPTTAFSFAPQWQQTSQVTTAVTFMGSFNAGRTVYNMWTNQASGSYGILWIAVGV